MKQSGRCTTGFFDGQDWSHEVVVQDLKGFDAEYPSICVTPSGHVYIAYMGGTQKNDRLRVAARGSSGEWQVKVIDADGNTGFCNHLVASDHGLVGLAYQVRVSRSSSLQEVVEPAIHRIALWEGGSWSIHDVAKAGWGQAQLAWFGEEPVLLLEQEQGAFGLARVSERSESAFPSLKFSHQEERVILSPGHALHNALLVRLSVEGKLSFFKYDYKGEKKFWEITLASNQVIIRSGKYGSKGRTLTKTFATPEDALQDADDRIWKKVQLEYFEVSGLV